MQGFVDDCKQHLGAMRIGDSWEKTNFNNGAEAMAGILEIMRIHEARYNRPPFQLQPCISLLTIISKVNQPQHNSFAMQYDFLAPQEGGSSHWHMSFLLITDTFNTVLVYRPLQ